MPTLSPKAGHFTRHITQPLPYFLQTLMPPRPPVQTKVILPRFKEAGKPFLIVFWSRDPDGTQHFQGDSLGQVEPGINGPTSLAAIRNADNNLAQLREALRTLGLEDSTDILLTADHGFCTISKASQSSPAAQGAYTDVPRSADGRPVLWPPRVP